MATSTKKRSSQSSQKAAPNPANKVDYYPNKVALLVAILAAVLLLLLGLIATRHA